MGSCWLILLAASQGQIEIETVSSSRASLIAQMIKNPPAVQETWVQSLGSIPGLGRFPGEGKGYPLQYPCLGNSMDRGAWQATVYGVIKSQT